MKELAELEAEAGIPARTRTKAIDEANERRSLEGLPELNPKTVSDWFNHGSPARDFRDLWSLVEVLLEWAEPRTRPERRGPAGVKQLYRLRWNDARIVTKHPLTPAQAQYDHTGPERPRLAEVILSAHDGCSLSLSDMFGPSSSRLPRAENRTGWELLPPALSGLRWGDVSWPISHRSHRVGYLLWHDRQEPCWELAMHDIGLKKESRFHALKYVGPPHAKQAGLPLAWADPAEALATLIKWKHYCPRTALAELFRMVDKGASAIEASQAFHITPSTGARLAKRAKLVHKETGRLLLDQVDDFMSPAECA
jgi:hypothetical protein